MVSVRKVESFGYCDIDSQLQRWFRFSCSRQSISAIVLPMLLGLFVFCLDVPLHAQGYPTGEPIVGSPTNVLVGSLIYLDSTQFAGSSLDARVTAAESSCPSSGCTIDSRAESSCAINSTITLSKPVHWILPYCNMPESSGANIVVSGAGSSITCDQLWTCILDGSSNNSLYTVSVTASNVSLFGFKILGGRMNVQTDTGLHFGGTAGLPITDCIADTVWIVNAGLQAITMQDCNNFQVKNSVIEKSGSAGIGVNALNGDIGGLIADNQLYDAVVNYATATAPINISSTGGPAATSPLLVRGNRIIQGNLGPSVIGTSNGGAQGTVSVTNGSATITWASGDTFVTNGNWTGTGGTWVGPAWHILIGGQYDQQISTVNSSTSITATTMFPGATGAYPFLVYAVPADPAYKQCGGLGGGSGTGITATNGSTAISLTGGVGAGAANGFTSCSFGYFTPVSTWNGWNINIAGVIYTINTCTSLTTCSLTTNYTGTTGTTKAWQAYPTPANTDTSGGEGIQLAAKADNVIVTENYLFNISDEGIVCGNHNCVVADNEVRNTGQSCTGCGGIIDSCQTAQAVCTVGPATITGNVVEADSTFGADAKGQSGQGNSNGGMNYGVWLHVAGSAAGTSCVFQGINVSGNSAALLGQGTITNGFLASNSSTNSCVVSQGVNIGPNSWDINIATPVNIVTSHFSGSWNGLDTGIIAPTSTSAVGLTVNNPASSTADIADFKLNGTKVASFTNNGNLALGVQNATAGSLTIAGGSGTTPGTLGLASGGASAFTVHSAKPLGECGVQF